MHGIQDLHGLAFSSLKGLVFVPLFYASRTASDIILCKYPKVVEIFVEGRNERRAED